FKLPSPLLLCHPRQRLQCRLGGFADTLTSKGEVVPPNRRCLLLSRLRVVVRGLKHRHFTFPLFFVRFLTLPFGLPPFLPFSRAISCSRSMPKRSRRALQLRLPSQLVNWRRSVLFTLLS